VRLPIGAPVLVFANLATLELVADRTSAPVSSLPCPPAKQGRCAASLVSADSGADAPLPSFARISRPASACTGRTRGSRALSHACCVLRRCGLWPDEILVARARQNPAVTRGTRLPLLRHERDSCRRVGGSAGRLALRREAAVWRERSYLVQVARFAISLSRLCGTLKTRFALALAGGGRSGLGRGLAVGVGCSRDRCDIHASRRSDRARAGDGGRISFS
jgi:hypothetical protein